MRFSPLLRAGHVHKPMIHFIGKRSLIEHGPHTPAPHHSAPKEVVESFQDFLTKLQSSSTSSPASSSSSSPSTPSPSSSKGPSAGADKKDGTKVITYDSFLDAPKRLSSAMPLEAFEIEAIESGGATL